MSELPWRRVDTWICLGLWVGCLLLYGWGGATTIQPADNADFLTVVGIAGVAHPPGYPLYTMLGIAVHALLPVKLPLALSWLSAMVTGGTVVGVFCVVRRLVQNRWAALGGAVLSGSSLHIWKHATHAEAFALLGCFAVWLTLFALRAADPERPLKARIGDWFVYALLAGLASSHHHTIAFTAPMGVLLLVRLFGHPELAMGRKLRVFGLGCAIFVLGLTPHLYLVVQGATPKLGSWGILESASALRAHVLREVYGTFRSGGTGQRLAPFAAHSWEYLKQSLDPTGTFPLGLALCWLLGVVGLFVRFSSWRIDRAASLALLASWLATGPLFLMLLYMGTIPVHRYLAARFFLLPDVFLGIFSGVGLAFLGALLAQGERFQRYQKVAFLCLGVLWLGAVIVQAPRASSRGHDWMERYLRDLLRELPPKALLVAPGDDVLCFGVGYLQQVVGLRKDVRFVCRAFLSQPWYLRQRAAAWPEFRGLWNAPMIASFSFIEYALRIGLPVHVTSLYHRNLQRMFALQPYGLTFRVQPKGHPLPKLAQLERELQMRYRAMHKQTPLPDNALYPWPASLLRQHYPSPWLMLASLYRKANKPQDAARCVAYAKRWALLLGREP